MTESIKDKTANKVSNELEKETSVDNNPKKVITLTRTRKSTSLLKVKDTSGKAKTIKVQVRKKRTYVKSNEGLIDEETNRANEAKETKEAEELALQAEKTATEKLIASETPTESAAESHVPTDNVSTDKDSLSNETVEKEQVPVSEKEFIAPTANPEKKSKPINEKVIIALPTNAERLEREKKHKNRNLKEKELQKESENETLKSELSFLRSQISPHFMFNVLNSVVSLSRRKPEMVEPVVIKLSELMRYMLYETNDSSVPLEKEALYLESYIDLQKIRFGNDISINFEQNITNKSNQIEPMLLIPFVENAFKHGVGLIENPTIDIHLKSDNSGIFFTVSNKVNSASKLEKKDDSSGIGLSNVKRRLELLHPNHHLKINETNEVFTVELHIIS